LKIENPNKNDNSTTTTTTTTATTTTTTDTTTVSPPKENENESENVNTNSENDPSSQQTKWAKGTGYGCNYDCEDWNVSDWYENEVSLNEKIVKILNNIIEL